MLVILPNRTSICCQNLKREIFASDSLFMADSSSFIKPSLKGAGFIASKLPFKSREDLRAKVEKTDGSNTFAVSSELLDKTSTSGRALLGGIPKDSLKTIDAAKQVANEISSDLRTLSKDELLTSVIGEFDPLAAIKVLRS
jgi:hypothetical protein